jgi:hypothetical protein
MRNEGAPSEYTITIEYQYTVGNKYRVENSLSKRDLGDSHRSLSR